MRSRTFVMRRTFSRDESAVDPCLAAGKAAYMASKYTMTLTALAVAEEWAQFNVAGNALCAKL